MDFKNKLIELIRKTATEIPHDVLSALQNAYALEENPKGKEILSKILENCKMAKDTSRPLCQDTGIPLFYVKRPKETSEDELRTVINESLSIATQEVPLRPNAVDSMTGENLGNLPVIHFEESDALQIALLLKGGGSENVSAIYQLPNKELNALRDLEGVKKCVLDAVFKAQGKGCPPYMIGAALGGNMEEVAHFSKKQLLRKINDTNPVSSLKLFEEDVLKEVNDLGVGPLGLGGNTTALSVKITHKVRHPTTFFVGISLSCWCMRRGEL